MQEKLIELLKQYKIDKNETKICEIIKLLEPLIKKQLTKIPQFYKEDIAQELRFGVFKIINDMKIMDIDIDKELFTNDNYKILKAKNYSKEIITDIMGNKYIYSFIKENGIEMLENAFNNYDAMNIFIEKYRNFSIQNQFLLIIKKRFSSIIAAFYRKNLDEINNVKNILIKNEVNLIYEIPDEYESIKKHNENIFYKFNILEEDISFLKLFIDGNTILSQNEVAQKLGVSQQFISKKIKTIKAKYNKNI